MEKFTDWRENAECTPDQLEIFYPPRTMSYKAAKEICSRCVVVDECLQQALDNREIDYGYRGNMTPNQRRAVFNEQ